MFPATSPLVVPPLPLLPVLGLLVALLPAWVSPPPPDALGQPR
jgi:energy-coupling factor transport system permease protein